MEYVLASERGNSSWNDGSRNKGLHLEMLDCRNPTSAKILMNSNRTRVTMQTVLHQCCVWQVIQCIVPPDLLSKYVDGDVRGIELFARNLLPGWMSWGNEVRFCAHCVSVLSDADYKLFS